MSEMRRGKMKKGSDMAIDETMMSLRDREAEAISSYTDKPQGGIIR